MKKFSLLRRAIFAVWLLPCVLRADDVTDAIDEATASYKTGDFEGAAGMLEYAAGIIRQMRGGKLEDLLPEAPEGWTSEGASSQSMGAAMFGGGTTASKQYEKDDQSVTVTFLGDSPMLQTMGMMFKNPAMAAQAGMRFKRVNGEKILVKFDEEEKSGEATAFVGGKWMVTINGEGITLDQLLEWAGRIDFARLAKF